MTLDPRVVDAPDALPDFAAVDARSVQKLVLGQLGETQTWPSLAAFLRAPGGLAARCPNLTHLYLWGLDGFDQLSDLPASLRCLDVRGCPSLAHLPTLPASLERLILEQCPLVTALTAAPDMPRLVELSLRGSEAISEASALSLLRGAPALEVVDLSDLRALRSVPAWAHPIVDLRLNGCTQLAELPEWPPALRRLELRGTPLADTGLQPLPDSIDYLDLGGMRRLRKLPENWQRARTLFLFGSGVLAPPASEHGAAADENVAPRTREYFAECELVGRGQVKRCKLLLLGNGGAGKTCLALRLVGDSPQRTRRDHQPESERVGSTHGVQFHDWRVSGVVEDRRHNAAVHVWDFGGQDIYRNTHRVFLATGTVFVIVWSPEPAEPEAPGVATTYVDQPRPLGYWLDYIEQAGNPAGSEVVVVCSRRTAHDPAAWRRMQEEAGAERLAKLCVCFVDALAGAGQLVELQRALEARVARVVDAQGTSVPAHWEIAQELVERWLRQGAGDPDFERRHRQMTMAQFGAALRDEIRARAGSGAAPWARLRQAIDRGEFLRDGALDERRLTRVLEFLTHSGWLYWRPDLPEARVIVGQKWALAGIYTLLRRDAGEAPGSYERSVYAHLRARQGRFTLRDLERWGWQRDVPDPVERHLLIDFMARIGLCFPLVRGADAWLGVPTYVSIEHLPSRWDMGWPAAPHGRGLAQEHARQVVAHPGLHRGHWDAILRQLGGKFGRDGAYARDGLRAYNRDGNAIELQVEIGPRGFGGQIVVDVFGANATAVCAGLAKAIEAQVHSALARRTANADVETAAGERVRNRAVFFSYAWDPPPQRDTDPPAVTGYSLPVDMICAKLRGEASDLQVRILRDCDVLGDGDDLLRYIEQIETCDKVVVVHSDKYWRSPWCLYELTQLWHSFAERPEQAKDLVVFVFHAPPGSRPANPILDGAEVEVVRRYWQTEPTQVGAWALPTALSKVKPREALRDAVCNLLSNTLPEIARIRDWGLVWDAQNPTATLDKVLARLRDAGGGPPGPAPRKRR